MPANHGEHDQRILTALEDYSSPSGAGIAIVAIKDGKPIFQRQAGLADIGNAIPVADETKFQVGSLGKHFTSLLIDSLIGDGKLEKTASIRSYLTDLPETYADVTVEQLLYHTSGVPDYFELMALQGIRFDDTVEQDDVTRLIYRFDALNFTPGTDYSYSNSGYILLAEFAEKVTGKNFEDYVKEQFFAPSKMNDATLPSDRVQVLSNRAESFIQVAPSYYIRLPQNSATSGPGGIWMSINDLGSWLTYLQTDGAGLYPQIARLAEPMALPDNKESTNGAGISLVENCATPVFIQSGGDVGYRSVMMTIPDQNYGIGILSNAPNASLGEIAMKLTNVLLPKGSQCEEETQSDTTDAETEEEVDYGPAPQGIEGLYRSYVLDTPIVFRSRTVISLPTTSAIRLSL